MLPIAKSLRSTWYCQSDFKQGQKDWFWAVRSGSQASQRAKWIVNGPDQNQWWGFFSKDRGWYQRTGNSSLHSWQILRNPNTKNPVSLSHFCEWEKMEQQDPCNSINKWTPNFKLKTPKKQTKKKTQDMYIFPNRSPRIFLPQPMYCFDMISSWSKHKIQFEFKSVVP